MQLRQSKLKNSVFRIVLIFIGLWSAGCSPNMSVQPSYRPLDESSFFSDKRSARPIIPGTIAQGQAGNAAAVDEMKSNPHPLDKEFLNHGREQFDVFCSPCHGRLGNGEGMVVQRGFPRPPSYHTDRLRAAADGHFFAVITEGFGRMWSYANRTMPRDRWAITAYVRALQFSQSAPLSDAPEEARFLLEKTQ
jgi:mono/diheme cytochrome c family protein